MIYRLIYADVMEGLAQLADESIDAQRAPETNARRKDAQAAKTEIASPAGSPEVFLPSRRGVEDCISDLQTIALAGCDGRGCIEERAGKPVDVCGRCKDRMIRVAMKGLMGGYNRTMEAR